MIILMEDRKKWMSTNVGNKHNDKVYFILEEVDYLN